MSDIQPTEEHDKLVRLYLSMGFPYTRATDLACEIGTYRKRITELEAESLDYKAKWLDACHNHKVVSENRDAAIAGTAEATAILMQGKVAEAVRKRTVECADVAGYEFTKHDHTGYSVCNAILALNTPAPAKPVWCEHIHLAGGCVWTLKGKYTQGHWRDDVGWAVPEFMHHCPVAGCGKPRPEVCGAPRTKGS